MNSLKGKKVMLVAARFFGYEEEIRKKLIELGVTVDYFDQRPSNSFVTKALIRINKYFLAQTIRRYYANLIEKTKHIKYDYVLFISPEAITKNIFLKLRQAQSQATFILYMWDSFQNKSKSIKDIIQHFDQRFSFDKEDSARPELKMIYRPLFFLNDYMTVRQDAKREFDLLFIGTIHSDRHKILKRIKEICEKQNLTYFYYLYFPSKILFYVRALLDPSLWGSKLSDFSFSALKKDDIIRLVEKSRAVIDIQHPRQIGLTMRTVEVLGARRKLVSTNTDIINYDFYSPDNIQIIDRKNVDIDVSFLKTEMSVLSDEIFNNYSIDGWISDIFSLTGKKWQGGVTNNDGL